MFNKLVLGNEKAIIGGLSAGVLALLGQLGVNSQITLKEVIYSAVTVVVTHLAVYVSTNTSVQPATPVVPSAFPPVPPVTPEAPVTPEPAVVEPVTPPSA